MKNIIAIIFITISISCLAQDYSEISTNDLEFMKREAIERENLVKAEKINTELNKRKPTSTLMDEFSEELNTAVANEDYAKAAILKEKIKKLTEIEEIDKQINENVALKNATEVERLQEKKKVLLSNLNSTTTTKTSVNSNFSDLHYTTIASNDSVGFYVQELFTINTADTSNTLLVKCNQDHYAYSYAIYSKMGLIAHLKSIKTKEIGWKGIMPHNKKIAKSGVYTIYIFNDNVSENNFVSLKKAIFTQQIVVSSSNETQSKPVITKKKKSNSALYKIDRYLHPVHSDVGN